MFVFATFKVSGSRFNYPGAAQLVSLATSGCGARINSSVDTAKLTTSMILRVLCPLDSEWLADNQTVRCFAYNPTPTLTSSLLKN